MKKPILVTGGSGFLGTHVVEKLKKAYSVRVWSRRANAIPPSSLVSYKSIDLLQKKEIRDHLDPSLRAVIHLAGLINIDDKDHPAESIQTNTSMFLNLLDEMRARKMKPLVILVSTERVYGRRTGRVDENMQPFPLDPYTTSKIMNEGLLQMYHIRFGLPFCILRFSSIFGPGQRKGMFISDVIEKLLNRDAVPVGDLSVKKNFIYVDDAAEGIVKAVRCFDAGKPLDTIINMSNPDPVSLKYVAAHLKYIIEKKMKKRKHFLTDPTLSRPPTLEVKPITISIHRAKKMLGWRPRTSFKKGLEKTIQYFLDQKNI